MPASEIGSLARLVARVAGTVLTQNTISLSGSSSLRIGFSTASGAINSCVLLACCLPMTRSRSFALSSPLGVRTRTLQNAQWHVFCDVDHSGGECSHVQLLHHSAERLTRWRHHTLGELAEIDRENVTEFKLLRCVSFRVYSVVVAHDTFVVGDPRVAWFVAVAGQCGDEWQHHTGRGQQHSHHHGQPLILSAIMISLTRCLLLVPCIPSS